ncbi:MAG TPA: MoxR family ATPase [Acidobacteriota bacterium]|nr:MoxR family ATPase [Acidobacteriota bacterium]HQM62310.1 MoxR family ATPase [Acidobacteriota bacterium]
MASVDIQQLNEQIQADSAFLTDIRTEVRKVIIGQEYIVERLLVGLLTHGHILLEGVPGLAKTLSVQTLARTIAARFQRIQFTPDLLPADLTGTMVFNPKTGEFHPRQGPLFANLILADEINRAPAKVQSALLEAMQERQVTIGDTTFPLPQPFLVLATQNPIEQEGTYPLPEAQVDRFMLKLRITYPSRKEERDILDRMATAPEILVRSVVSPEQILRASETIRRIYVDDKLKDYVVNLVCATRTPAEFGLDLKSLIDYGASPRATIFLIRAAMAHAFLNGRGFVIPEDIKALALDVLRHRIILSYEAESEELTADDLIARVFDAIPVP